MSILQQDILQLPAISQELVCMSFDFYGAGIAELRDNAKDDRPNSLTTLRTIAQMH